ncbi:hypothetical protein N7G274_000142 [Stereocaulon virgatum]|uniref:DUF1308 domain-containing protein n=1 Tax=Stereocaulon virgatum TaxID=373712 RepID=A0ABR4ATU5_9LECA
MVEEEINDTSGISANGPMNTEIPLKLNGETPSTDGAALAEDLLKRCRSLLTELDDFGAFVLEQKLQQEPAIEIRKFQTSVATELKSLEKLAEADLTAEKAIHTLRSSNLPFYSAIWKSAKASERLVTFHKRFYWDNRPTRDLKRAAQKRCALVDIVARNGEEWIKVSTVTESRLVFEIAKAQWEVADSSSSGNEEADGSTVNGTTNGQKMSMGQHGEIDRIELVKVADDLLRASNAHRVHYKHPQIRFVLPKISSEPPEEILPILDRIRSTGAIIDLGSQEDRSESLNILRAKIFSRLLPSPHPPLTDTLNIDCTILLALVSDRSISHIESPDPTKL